METIFTKILKGEIPSIFLHKDELCFSILDINPVNKGHLLIITTEAYPTLESCPEAVLSHMMVLAKKADKVLREKLGCDATNVIINNGKESGQEVPHLHLHIIPRYKGDGKTLHLVKETYSDGEIADYGKKLEF
ncbi:HIT family protein [Sphaerochaeta halotolerans]|jgi:histidine triad (HIT) family protein|uniref:HIT family protein n=1 Tax=Sphaerochaeta halotolerans TaxID=2293840 RepID=A0A372MK07_9SPIR|nr:HIT family protein [Sphaerochaeta halotolerans]MBG0766528.1 HIT family protein [Spirochaetaceae bacterium]MDK2859071.1 histidine triad family protein [Sphaerochaeta sp.]MDN5332789.1 histidine triad family protein [Sphaerochaeta sp.]MXI85189.1 HIT domain-containing protein [Sphaerochaeta halotolerans]RFU95773.1 HIT family protein [Sphaerochaeta halotolerans]